MRLKSLMLAIVVTVFFLCSFSYAESLDQVVAVVDDEVITASELGRIVGPVYYQYKNTYEGAELEEKMTQVQNDALKQLIENKLLLKEAKSIEGLSVENIEVQQKLEEVKARFASEEEFETLLEKDRTSIDDLKSQLKEQILVKKLLGMKVYSHITVSPREVEAYYQKNTGDFIENEKIKMFHILIKKGDDSAKAKEKIEEALAAINNGESFEDTAKKYSQGPHADKAGDIGFFEKGYMLKKIEDAAFALEVGKYSDVVETPIGYHLIFLQSRKKGSKLELKDVWDNVEDKVYRNKVDEKYKDFIDTLSRKTYISIVR